MLKVERFFRTVRERFLAKQRFTSLDEMNQAFEHFLEDYHNKIHSTLKCTPMQKRMSVESVCRRLPETVDMEAMFRQERRCRIYGDCTIRLKTKVYEVPACLPNSHVTVYFMPWDLSRVHYAEELDANYYKTVFIHYGGLKRSGILGPWPTNSMWTLSPPPGQAPEPYRFDHCRRKSRPPSDRRR